MSSPVTRTGASTAHLTSFEQMPDEIVDTLLSFHPGSAPMLSAASQELNRSSKYFFHRHTGELATQRAWRCIREKIMEANPQLAGAPEINASVEKIRTWMHAGENRPALHSFTWLDLGSLKLTRAPMEVNLCRRLDGLCLYNNLLPSLPQGGLQGLTALQGLFLWNNQFSSLPEGVFLGLVSLTELSLERNLLSTLPDRCFQGMTALKILELYRNRLSSLQAGTFEGLTALEELRLGENQLSSLPEGIFQELTALRELSLYNNQLSSLPEGLFQGLAALQILGLSQNRLTSLPPGILHGLTALRRLSLGSNRLSSLPHGIFQGLAALTELFLGNNRLVSFPQGVFQGMPPLRILGLHGNRGLLHVYGDLKDHYHTPLLESMEAFFDYACCSAFARFYQFAAGNFSLEAVQDAFSRLPDPVKNALYGKVWEEAGRPDTSDSRWGEHHAFDEMQIFYGALKKLVRDSFETLDSNQKNAVYFHIYHLARSGSGAEGTDFDIPNWGELHALENVPRLIDAIMQVLFPINS